MPPEQGDDEMSLLRQEAVRQSSRLVSGKALISSVEADSTMT